MSEKIDCCTVNNLASVTCRHYLLVKITRLLCPEVFRTVCIRFLKFTVYGVKIWRCTSLLFDNLSPCVLIVLLDFLHENH